MRWGFGIVFVRDGRGKVQPTVHKVEHKNKDGKVISSQTVNLPKRGRENK